MSDKLFRTFLISLFILIILPPAPAKGYQPFLSTIADDFMPEGETQSEDAAEEPGTDIAAPSEASEETPAPEISQAQSSETQSSEPEPDAVSESDMENGVEHITDYEELPAAYGLELSERVVKTFDELREALGSDNGITTVHLGDDITMRGGIGINSAKPHITIDGFDPGNPGQTEPYTLTDFDSAVFTDTIYVNSPGLSYVHVRNLKIVGKNYYGPVSVLDSAAMSSVKLIFERVDYNGPQLGYHRQGTIYVIDCTSRLHGGNGICSSQEFSEAKELIFEGVNTIDSATTALSIFWHPLGGSFTVADDSSITLSSPNTSGTYGMFYADGSAYSIDITIGRRAVFDAAILNSAAPPLNVTLSGITVYEGGSFSLTTTGSANRAVLSVGGDITIGPDASFIISSYGGNYPVLNLSTGDVTVGKDAVFHIISANTNSSLLNLYGRSFICDDPASVLLYNSGNRNISATTNPGKIYLEAEQINYWDTASAGGLDEPPLYQWKKANGENIIMDGTLATGAAGNLSVISSNYDEGDSPGTPFGGAFNMAAARVIALGRLELMVNTPTAASGEITGVTAPGADVRAVIHRQESDYVTPDASADKNGVFAARVDVPLQYSDAITVMSAFRYLTAKCLVSVGDAGTLTFTVPEQLRFSESSLSAKPQIIKRANANWQLVVWDTRGGGNTWSVYVSQVQPLTPADVSKPILENSLLFVDASGAITPLGTGATPLIYRHTTGSDSEMVNIGWPDGQGILVSIPTGAAYSDQPYSGILEWSLTDTP